MVTDGLNGGIFKADTKSGSLERVLENAVVRRFLVIDKDIYFYGHTNTADSNGVYMSDPNGNIQEIDSGGASGFYVTQDSFYSYDQNELHRN
jgi:hypothetical protein